MIIEEKHGRTGRSAWVFACDWILPDGKVFFVSEASMTPKARIMDEAAVGRAMARIAHEIIERNQGAEQICLLGVKRRGVPLAQLLASKIQCFWEQCVPVGVLDVTEHRDDLTDADKQVNAGQSVFPCDIQDKTVIIVDDVLFTGRTARAAMETVFSYGRPKAVQLMVLVDRGHRELPLRPDYVGKNVPTARNERIRVLLQEIDGETGVYICDV